MQRPLWQSQTESQTEKKSLVAPLAPSAKAHSLKTPMGWSSSDSDPNALLLASVVPASPPSLVALGVRRLARFGLALWSVRTGDVLPWLVSLRPGVRWGLVACVSVIPVLGLYQRAASSAATRTAQTVTAAALTPAAPSAQALSAQASSAQALPIVLRTESSSDAPERARVPAPEAATGEESAAAGGAMAKAGKPDSPAEAAQPTERPQPEASAPLDEQPFADTDPSGSRAHKHRKSTKKAKARATKHATKAASRRHRTKPDAE